MSKLRRISQVCICILSGAFIYGCRAHRRDWVEEYAMSQSTRTMSETRCLALQGKQRGPSMDRRGLAPTFI
jgi:hypothetical protein